jgi:hypothetical protein
LKFPGCQIALRVDRDVIADDGEVRLSDTRYFLTSASPDDISAADLLSIVRGHWQIENSVFFLKDRWWDEDRHWTCRPGVAEWLTQLTTAATTVLRLLGNARQACSRKPTPSAPAPTSSPGPLLSAWRSSA